MLFAMAWYTVSLLARSSNFGGFFLHIAYSFAFVLLTYIAWLLLLTFHV